MKKTPATNRPILVTGSHRSGTTWVGRMIALDPDVEFIWEPFNPQTRKLVMPITIDRWFYYVTNEDKRRFSKALRDIVNFRYYGLRELKDIRTGKDLGRMVRDATRFTVARLRGKRALLKDPIAIMSAEFISTELDADVVVLIRNPFAFCASLKRAGWVYPFEHFLSQKELMSEKLSPYKERMEAFRDVHDIVPQGVLLWNCIHHVICGYQDDHNDWLFVRHEDLSVDPIKGFDEIYKHLGIRITSRVKNKIMESAGISSPSFLQKFFSGDKLMRRDARKSLESWRKTLTESEIEYIENNVDTEVFGRLYPDWAQ